MRFVPKTRGIVPCVTLAAAIASAAWLAGPRVLGLLVVTASVVAPAALAASLVGVPLGVLLGKTDVFARRFGVVTLIALLILPLHVVAAGWSAAFGFRGWVTALGDPVGVASAWLAGWRGAVVIHAAAAIPAVALLTLVALRSVDRRREEQALLDATPRDVLLRVSLPDSVVAIVAAVVWVATQASTEIAATDLFRVRTFAEEVYTQAALGTLQSPTLRESGAVGLLGGVLLTALVAALPLWVIARRSAAAIDGTTRPWIARLGRRRRSGTALVALLLTALVALPIGSLVYKAGERIERKDQEWTRVWSLPKTVSAVLAAPVQHRWELAASSGLGVAVAAGAVAVGGLAAWAGRGSGFRSAVLVAAVAFGMAVPGPVVGLVTIRLLNQPPDAGFGWLGSLYGTWFAPWLAQLLRLTPVAALLLWPVASSVPNALLDAARSDGAGPLARLWRVALPLQAPAITAVAVVVFALSVGELSATAVVTPPGTPPLSVRLLSLLHYGVEDRVAAICLVLFAAYAGAAWIAVSFYSPAERGLRRNEEV